MLCVLSMLHIYDESKNICVTWLAFLTETILTH